MLKYSKILCSSFADVMPKLLKLGILEKQKIKVAFIQNASDVDLEEYGSDPWWIKNDRQALETLGVEIEIIDLKKYNKVNLQNKLSEKDVVFVCGGNTFYLLKCMQDSGFVEIIHDLISKGLSYRSTSAGTCITSPDIEYCKFADEIDIVNLKNYNGLNFHDLYIDVHFGAGDRSEQMINDGQLAKCLNFMRNKQISPYICLANNQAICIDAQGMMKIV